MKMSKLNSTLLYSQIEDVSVLDSQNDKVKRVKHLQKSNIQKKQQCEKCNRKLRLTNSFKCKCTKIFCSMHRFEDKHSCMFDFKNEDRKQLAIDNPKIVKPKL